VASDFPVTYLLTLPLYLVVSSVDMKNLKILITYFLLEPLGCALVDPNVAGTGDPACVTVGHSGRISAWRRVASGALPIPAAMPNRLDLAPPGN